MSTVSETDIKKICNKIYDLEQKVNNLDHYYPVGSLYLSFKPTSPAELFGGSWVQLTDVFLRAADDTEPGGADTVTISVSQLASHSHVKTVKWGIASDGAELFGYTYVSPYLKNITHDGVNTTYSTGSDEPHSNMPAYQDIYVWRRTE